MFKILIAGYVWRHGKI